MDNYLKFLTSFLTDHDLHVDVNDYIRYADEARTPILVDGRRLALPTERHRRSPSDETILFHPLAENTVADLSPVMKEIIRLGSINLNILFTAYAVELVQLASDQGRQTSLTDAQIDLIAKLKSCKSSSEKNVAKIIQSALYDHSVKNQTNGFIQLALTRGREYRGEKRHRACSVVFPMYEQLLKDQLVPKAQAHFDLTKDVRDTIVEVHEALYPAVAEAEAYGYAEVTNRTLAPFFVTYALTYAQLAGEIRARYKTLQGAVQFTADDEPPMLDWVSDIQDTEQLRKWGNAIPDQTVFRASAPQTDYTPSSQPAPAANPAVMAKAKEVPYIGQKYVNASGQVTEMPPPATAAQVKGPEVPKNAISPDEFLRQYPSNSPFAAMQNTQSMLKAYIEGYGKFWDAHIENYRVAPQGLPHPTTIPPGQLPPAYPNSPALPMGFYPNGPMTATVAPVGAYGMPPVQPGYGAPMHPGMMPYGVAPQPGYGAGGGMIPVGYGGMPAQGHGYAPVGYGAAVNSVAGHPAFAGSNIGSGAVMPGTI